MILLASTAVPTQTGKTSPQTPADNKAEKIIQRAIEALGGSNYLNVRTVIGRGFFTPYKDGVPGLPSKFTDYLAYPDRERTEFLGGGTRVIQSNSNGQGWVFDGAAKTLKDQTPAQLEDFRVGMRTSVESLLHGWWRKEGATLSYAGRREAGLARRNETVRLTYADGFWVEYEFEAKEGLPAKVIYKRKQKRSDTDEMEELTEEDHLLKPISIDGVTSMFVIDHFINGVQASRANYEAVEYNREIPDSLFAKPATIKGLK